MNGGVVGKKTLVLLGKFTCDYTLTNKCLVPITHLQRFS